MTGIYRWTKPGPVKAVVAAINATEATRMVSERCRRAGVAWERRPPDFRADHPNARYGIIVISLPAFSSEELEAITEGRARFIEGRAVFDVSL